MTGDVTWDILIWLGGTGAAVLGLAWRILSWVLAQLKDRDEAIITAKKDAEEKIEHLSASALQTEKHLSEYKTHVAETYVTKSGMAEQTDRIMKAINDVGTRVETRVDGLGARLDNFYQSQPQRAQARRSL